MLRSTVSSPYRGTHSHLKEYSIVHLKYTRDILNYRHASLRNAIKRAFGGLKKHFPTNTTGIEPQYPFDIHTEIALACCIIHNFLMIFDPYDRLVAKVDRDLMNVDGDDENEVDYLERNIKRKNFAMQFVSVRAFKIHNHVINRQSI